MKSGKIGLLFGWLFFFIIILFFSSLADAGILIVSPHPDDDLLIAAGIMYRAVQSGEPVKIVYMTNGDYTGGKDKGFTRQFQAVNAEARLGIPENSMYFLGYPDGYLESVYNNCPDVPDACSNSWGQTVTYGKYGLGHEDYHSYRFGAPAAYNRYNILGDLEDIISIYKPDHIYTLVEFDAHTDHSFTYQFVKQAVLSVISRNSTYRPTVHKSLVWWGGPGSWPNAGDPSHYFAEIQDLSGITGYSWADRESVEVPADMQTPDYGVNLKALAIAEHVTEGGTGGFLGNFIHKDEIFWIENPGGGEANPNIAPAAAATASSQASEYGQLAVKAVDGVIDGYPGDYTKEWATNGQRAGAWLQLDWPVSYTVDRVVLYDRPNTVDQIIKATLVFSDGSALTVGPLANNGGGTEYTFPPKTTTGLRMNVDQVSSGTMNIGLAEIQVFGSQAGQTQYTLTTGVTPSYAGAVLRNPDKETYSEGEQVTLTATAGTGRAFGSWSGDAAGTQNPIVITMNGNKTVTANFVVSAGMLSVSPSDGLIASGIAGGPFSPSSKTYTLQNTGDAPISWNASATKSWVGLSSAGGSLASGATATVTISLVSSITNSLAEGPYSGIVTFNNATNGNGNTNRTASLTISAAAGVLSVSPADGLIASGPPGGPLAPSAKTYTFQNTGNAPITWAASATQGWLSLSPAGGILASGATATVSVSLVSGVTNSLAAGSYSDTVTVTNMTNGTGNTTRMVSLAISAAAGSLSVTPSDGLNVSGLAGGPFNPTAKTYTLQNTGSAPIGWSASATQSWVALSPAGGSLASGATATVTVSLVTSAVNSLVAGPYSDSVSFTNTTSGAGNSTRPVTLSVQPASSVNIAPLASVIASSETARYGQLAVSAVDGVVDGYPGDYTKEWATNRQGAGAWLQLEWSAAYSVDRVVLYDRLNLADRVTRATLVFSDGSMLSVGPLSNNGEATAYSFPPKVITSLRMTVDQVSSGTVNIGLAEVQVFGSPAAGSQYPLTVNALPAGAGSVTRNPDKATYAEGEQVTLTATAGAGYGFANWSGDASGAGNPIVVTMNGSKTVMANFIATAGVLSVTPSDGLTASGAPGGPFTPSAKTYTLQNTGNAEISWAGSTTQSWVALSPAGGSLAAGATATISLVISAANSLAAGSYSDTVSFTNTTNGIGNAARPVTLSVQPASSVNIAPLASVTASSETAQYGQLAVKAVDGVIDGYPGDYTKEWVTNRQGAGAWLQLEWSAAYSVDRVVLYDRVNGTSQIVKATLAFSDGSMLSVGPLYNYGGATAYTFAPKVITSLRMTVDQVSSTTQNTGLAEIEVFGTGR